MNKWRKGCKCNNMDFSDSEEELAEYLLVLACLDDDDNFDSADARKRHSLWVREWIEGWDNPHESNSLQIPKTLQVYV